MFTVAVLNQKGGVGKTTLAVNLAAVAHIEKRRTLLVDMDEQGSASEWYAARSDESPLAGLVVVKMDRPLTLAKFRELATGYDFVVLDGPPRLDKVSTSAAVAADVVVMPVSPGPFDLWATSSTLATLDEADAIRAQLDRSPVRRVFVINRAEVGTVLTREMPEALGERGEVLDAVVHQRIAFKTSALDGESVVTMGDGVVATQEIRAVYRAITGRRRK
jgi:chromosome partitioning protein